MVRHINDNLGDFSSSDESDKSDEEKIKTIWLMFFENVFLREQFQK